MNIVIKTAADIEKMRIACRLAAEVLDHIAPFVKPGVTTEELDRRCHDYMVNVQGSIPAPLNYAPPGYTPYPKSICTSINQVICHGVPSPFLWEKWAAYKEVGVGAALRAVAAGGHRFALLRMDREEAEGLAGHPLPERADTARFAATLVDGMGDFVQVAQLRLHRLSIGFEFVAAGIDFRNDLRHVWLPITPFH